jgi:sterol desaturase/sphingolipid hydroxylase (fatty acid hydroxylase superfamily)
VIYDSPRDFYILFFPPWVIFGFAVIHGPIAYYLLSMFLSPNIVFLYLGMSTLYFFLYEVLHYISHLPKDHWVLKVPYFSLMWRHHVNHHNPKLMQQYNFNIVFPFFDYVFGTVYHPGQMEDQKAKKL